MVASPQRPQRDPARLEPPQLATEGTRRRPVERPADGEAGDVDRLERDDAPGRAVELDRDAARARGHGAR